MAKAERRRVGVLGGTFDPPHVGHAIVAQDLVERLALDRLLVVPAAHPPHRSASLAPEVRLALTRRLFAAAARIEVSDLEHRRPAPSFTVDTLAALREGDPEAEHVLVMGADQLAVIDTWHEWRRLPELASIAVMRRSGEEPRLPHGVTGIEYIAVDVTRVDVSASRIRERLTDGRSIRFLVPESIRDEVERAWREREARPGDARSEIAGTEP